MSALTTLGKSAVRSLRSRLARRMTMRFQPKTKRIQQLTYRGSAYILPMDEDVGWRLWTSGSYEGAEMDWLAAEIRPGDCCFDVGANAGLYSVLMARLAHQGDLVAFEPIAFNQHLIHINLGLNAIERAEVVASAVGRESGSARFSVSSDSAYSSLHSTGRKAEAISIEVPLTSLDDFVRDRGVRPDVVKIDVEGAELDVIEGASSLLASDDAPRLLLVELSRDNLTTFGTSPETIVRRLKDFGYTPWSLTPLGPKPGWPQPRASENVAFKRL